MYTYTEYKHVVLKRKEFLFLSVTLVMIIMGTYSNFYLTETSVCLKKCKNDRL